MDKLNFDDIVRNLLVFLKGQVPSIQSKTNRDDLTRTCQAIVYMLRTSIIQLEGAASVDFRSTPEYKTIAQEIESSKKTVQRLEESLFLEMNKSQRLTTELDKANATIEQLKKDLSEAKEASPQVMALNREIERLKTDLAAKPTVDPAQTATVDDARRQLEALRKSLTEREFALTREREKSAALEERREAESVARQALQAELDRARQDALILKQELGAAVKPEKSLPADLDRIRQLQETVAKLQDSLSVAPSSELLQNIQAASEAKIAYLEKALTEARAQAQETTVRLSAAPEQVEILKKEKTLLDQRIIDLESTVRRLTASRAKAIKETPSTPTLRVEEFVFLFEVLSSIHFRLAKSPENKDIRQRSEEAIAILERAHAIESIPAVGYVFDEKLHKVVRAFSTPFVEDGTVIYEVNKGFRSVDHVIQRSVVWIAKNRFKCTECQTMGRPQDYFCSKCGLELTAPDGSTKRKIPPLPTTMEVIIPLIDFYLARRQVTEAGNLLDFLAKDHAENPALVKRRNLLAQMASAPPAL